MLTFPNILPASTCCNFTALYNAEMEGRDPYNTEGLNFKSTPLLFPIAQHQNETNVKPEANAGGLQ